MAEANGLLVDQRTLPRGVQEIACEKGMSASIPVESPRPFLRGVIYAKL
jgi:hypothetical protein